MWGSSMWAHDIALAFLVSVLAGLVLLPIGKYLDPVWPPGGVKPYLIVACVLVVAAVLTLSNLPFFAAPNGGGSAGPAGIGRADGPSPSAVTTVSPAPSPTPAPSPKSNPSLTPPSTQTCSNPPPEWPKTPQEAASDFGGQPYNWYPDYFQINGGRIQWDQTTWVFQDSPLKPGVTLSADGTYIDSNGNLLTLVESSRGDTLWNYNAPLDFPTVQLGQLGRDGRAHMVVRTGSQASHHAMTKRWGYGSVVFPDAEAGVVRLVWCSADQLDAARQDALKEYNGPDPDRAYTDWMWGEGSGQFSQPPKSS